MESTIASRAQINCRWRLIFGSIALLLGLLRVWLGRSAFHGIDGVSYLDMGDAFMRGDSKTALNGVWSPLFPLVTGATLKFVKPSIVWELPTVHIVCFVIYVGALVCFDFLWTEFGRVVRERCGSLYESWVTCGEWAWPLLGYCLFLWVCLQLIGIVDEGADMLVAAAVYLAGALLLRISRDKARIGTFIVLGLVLGFGYLAKAILFPLSFVFLLVAAFVAYKKRRSCSGPIVALMVFLLIAGPFIAVLSRAKGRLTFGDAGTINYLWHVDGVPRMYWQGIYSGSGEPIHPPRRINAYPAVYEFATPFSVTFAPWYDPSYWYEGMRPHFELKKQFRALIEAVGIYHGLFLKPGAVLLVSGLVLLLAGGSLNDLAERLDLILPALAALGAYALVHVEPRYVGSFILLIWGSVLCQVRLPRGDLGKRLLKFSVLAVAVIYSTESAVGMFEMAAEERAVAPLMREQIQVSESMHQVGLQPGDPVAAVAAVSSMPWARLAKLRIVSDSPDESVFWSVRSNLRSKALAAFAATGAKAVVAVSVPAAEQTEGWIRIGQTDFYIYSLVPTVGGNRNQLGTQ